MSDNTTSVIIVLTFLLGLPVLLGLGMGLASLGQFIGDALEDRRERKDARLAHRQQLELEAARRHTAPKNATVCGCDHDLAFHNRDTGICHHGTDEKRCTCQQYTGPELMPEFVARDIAGLEA